MTSPTNLPQLDQWLQLRDLSPEDVKRQFPQAETEPNVSYYQINPATCMITVSGDFYFQDGVFALLYIEDDLIEGAAGINADSLKQALGAPEHFLRSRVGKTHRLHMYPSIGLAYSAGVEGIDFIEIFPPMTIETYKATIYEEPLFR